MSITLKNLSAIAFDIETVPDVELLRALNKIPDSSICPDEKVMDYLREEQNITFLPCHLHKVVAISCASFLPSTKTFRVGTLGKPEDDEQTIINDFFKMIKSIEKYSNSSYIQLVSWNGNLFDLPTLIYRGLKHDVDASAFYRDSGDYRMNNYTSRYHNRHYDVMDVMAMFSGKNAPLDEMSKMCGFAGKQGIDGSQVYPNYLKGNIDTIRNYCETDALNTFLLFAKFQKMRGHLAHEEYSSLMHIIKRDLLLISADKNKPHLLDFLYASPEILKY